MLENFHPLISELHDAVDERHKATMNVLADKFTEVHTLLDHILATHPNVIETVKNYIGDIRTR